MANGRCRKHGGVCAKTHAGNQHAVKHGVHAAVLPEEIEAVLNEDPSLIARIAVAVGRVRILRAHEAGKDELVAKLLPGIVKGAATIAALERADGGGDADADNQAERLERRKKLEDVLKSVKPAGPAGPSAVDSVQPATGAGSDLPG